MTAVSEREVFPTTPAEVTALVAPERPMEVAVPQLAGVVMAAVAAPRVGDHERLDVEASPYDIDHKPKELIRGLYQDVLTRREQDGGAYSSTSVVIMDCSSPYANVYRHVEAREFKQWYPDKAADEFAEEMEKEYAPYDRDSKLVLVMDMDSFDEDGLPILTGMGRAVGKRPELLKTVNDMPEVWHEHSREEVLADLRECSNEGGDRNEACTDKPVGDPVGTWDFASLAVTEGYQGTRVHKILSHELYRLAAENNIDTVTTILVKDLFDTYTRHGIPFRAIAGVEPRVHMEELSVPAVMHLPEVAHFKDSDNPIHKYIWEFFGNNDAFDHFRVSL